MTRRTLCLQVSLACVLAPVAAAQTPSVPRCYQLTIGPWSGTPDEFQAPPTTIRLDTTPDTSPFHRGFSGRAIPPSTPTTGYWIVWSVPASDSLRVVHFNGENGVVFAFHADGDTLRGIAEAYTDLLGQKPPFAQVRAIRVVCPSS
jgi:hypothetical protein